MQTPPPSQKRAAYCDIDGTLAATNIVMPLMWFKRRQLRPLARWAWLLSLGLRGLWWLLLDRASRGASNRAIYANYAGLPVETTKQLAELCFNECLKPRLFPQALEELAALRHAGVELVLVTGGLDFIARPIAEYLKAELIAPKLVEQNGVFTGALAGGPLTGAGKAEALREHSRGHGIELAQCYAFGDAYGDLPMLEAVGNPVAVNPDRRLAKIARARGWQLRQWR